MFASSSRLFTAFLGRVVSHQKKIPLFLDIRDVFVDTIDNIFSDKKSKWPLMKSLATIERYTFSNANHINLISPGFRSYFIKYQRPGYSYFTNGIDDEFLQLPESVDIPRERQVITYAGNIGEGQGLHKIIPQAAKKLGNNYFFRIIGDGGMKQALVQAIETGHINNVELIPPTSREKLMEYYNESHYLFLHLNDYAAFEKVLPSKIFEYGAYDKPIIAGVNGFSAEFIAKNLNNYILFPPGDVTQLVDKLQKFKFKYEMRPDFKRRFNRKIINQQLASRIISYA